MTHPALESPESRACVEAVWAVNPDGAAELLAAFPEAVFSWGQTTVEGRYKPAAQAGSRYQPAAEGSRQGRLL
jgi:hypothetical protein